MGCPWNRDNEPVFATALDFRMTRLRDYEKFYALCLVKHYNFLVLFNFTGEERGAMLATEVQKVIHSRSTRSR